MKRIGNYCYDETTDKLGEGGFGAVYKGRHVQDPQKIAAIKAIKKTNFTAMRPEVIDREITILKNLSTTPHRNLVSFLDCTQSVTTIYLIMEFCNGGDLGNYLRAKIRLDESTILRFFKQIASGLKFIHGKNIVHRDLKPANVLLCFTGGRYPAPKDITLKIADFGLGKYRAPYFHNGTVCGTPVYMAPEIRCNHAYDNRVDVWSVGVMMFQCLTGNLNGAPDFLNFLQLPCNTSQSLSSLLRSLLMYYPQMRLNCDKFLNHVFFGKSIVVSVRGPRGFTTIRTNENAAVHVLISQVLWTYGLAGVPGFFQLIHNGRHLEHGRFLSVKNFGIVHGSTLFLVH